MNSSNSIITLIVCLFLSLGAQAQTLKLATIAPEGSSWMKDMRAGSAEIEQRTGGRVKFKFYGGGVQGNDKQVQRKMRTGQLHGGAFTSGGMNRFQGDSDIYALALLFNNIEEVNYVRARLDAVLRQRLEDAGYVNFGFAGAGFAYMMSDKPLKTRQDFNGQKVWTPEGDEASYAALQALGVAPVTMPVTDVLTGLETDLLNSVTVPPVGAVVLQWHTRLKYITDLPIAYVYAALLIDRKAFNRISQDDQQVVREVFEKTYAKFNREGPADNAQALEALQESGLTRVTPDETEVNSWRTIVMQSHRKLAQQGSFDGSMLSEIQQLLDEYRAQQR